MRGKKECEKSDKQEWKKVIKKERKKKVTCVMRCPIPNDLPLAFSFFWSFYLLG